MSFGSPCAGALTRVTALPLLGCAPAIAQPRRRRHTRRLRPSASTLASCAIRRCRIGLCLHTQARAQAIKQRRAAWRLRPLAASTSASCTVLLCVWVGGERDRDLGRTLFIGG